MADFRSTIEAIDEEQIDELIQPDTSQQDAISGQIAEQEGIAERISTSMQRADDAFVSGAMDDERYRRQVDRLNAQYKATQNEIARLRRELADEQSQAKRRERIESLAAIGLGMLDGDATKCNIWLRRDVQVRLWVEDGQLTHVEYL